ncbi:MAG: hypothetical protein ABSA53_35960 [Streptosporangiaceae bacterium]
MDRGLVVGELAEAVGRADQPAGLARHLPGAHPDQADRAHRAGLGVGRLEVDGREVEAHRAPGRNRAKVSFTADAGHPVEGPVAAKPGILAFPRK